MKHIRTRIAPSPTGETLHIGNVYTALINYVVAKKSGGEFIVRVEDTDQLRLVKGSEDRILDALSWLGIAPDESVRASGPFAPYRQSDRLPLYKKYAQELIGKKHAYYCFCTSEELDEMRKKQLLAKKIPQYDGRCKTLTNEEIRDKLANGQSYVIRLAVPDSGKTGYDDLIRGHIEFENALIDDQVLLKSDGFPTYHLAVVIDDHLMEISHVIRAEEWISSTPKQLLLYAAFGWEVPHFAHVPLLRNPDKSKLSKRKNPVWVSWYREQGFLPEAILNYLGTIGWSIPRTLIESNRKQGKPEELFSIDQMISHFEISDIQTSAPVFDLAKLTWLNGEYIRALKPAELQERLSDFYDDKYDTKKIQTIIPLVQERIKTIGEFAGMVDFFFTAPKEYEYTPDKAWLEAVVEKFSEITSWNHETLLSEGRIIAENLGVPFKKLAMDIRIAVTGKKIGPPLFESMELLGSEESLKRLKAVA